MTTAVQNAEPPQPVVPDLQAYLASDEVIDWHSPAVERLSRELTDGCETDVSQARALFEWVRDFIPHTRDTGREEVTCAASDVLSVGTGICYAKSHLLAALLRAVGIPAGFCYQTYHEPLLASENKIALHGLNGVYLLSLERWIRLDSRGNTDGARAEFNLAAEQLAFPELELLDDLVYPKPLPCIVRALMHWSSRSELWAHLPQPEWANSPRKELS